MNADQARRLLSVGQAATVEELRTAYRVALKTAHPDMGGTDERLRATVEAYRILTETPKVSTRRTSSSSSSHSAHRSSSSHSRTHPGDQFPRLEITPVMAVVGGRTETRLPDGRRVAITLPPGLRQGDRISLMSTVLSITIKGRPEMFVSGDDLCMVVRTTADILKDGGRLQIKTPTGPRTVWVPKLQAGANGIVRIPGQGLPANGRHKQGALILKLTAEKGGKETRTRTRARRTTGDWQAA